MTCAEVIKDMCSALLYAHQQGVIHFDVKPSNIFYDDAKKLWKLGDFGLSKPITTSANISPRGSFQYMAPEVREHKGTSKSDIYSLGRVCAEILTGSPDGDIANADKQYPRESRPKVREYAAIIEKMLNVNPTERPTIVEVKKVFLKSATWTGNEKRRAI
jgi:serine/threonine protein kinase